MSNLPPSRPGGRDVGLVVGQDGEASRIGARHQGFDIEVAALDHQHQIARDRSVDIDDVEVDAELAGDHASGVADALYAIDPIADRQGMQHAAGLRRWRGACPSM